MDKVELISFDADQTLFDFQRVMREALQEVAEFLRRDAGIMVSVETLRDVRDRIAARFAGQAVDMLELRRLSFAEVLADHTHQDALVTDAMDVFVKLRFGAVYLYPGVQKTLAALKRQCKIALITNGNSDPEKAGLDGYFDHVLLGEKFPFKKPDPRIFHHLYSIVGISDPSTTMHVGDSLESDIQGANSVGAVAVWFNPDGKINTHHACPDHTIRSMPELLGIVQERQSA